MADPLMKSRNGWGQLCLKPDGCISTMIYDSNSLLFRPRAELPITTDPNRNITNTALVMKNNNCHEKTPIQLRVTILLLKLRNQSPAVVEVTSFDVSEPA